VEGAENGTSNVTAVISTGYTLLASDVKASGSYSFHLAHSSPGTDQILTLNPELRPGTNSQLTFSKRLGYATSSEVAHAQISTNSGASWQDLWSQAGANGSGDGSFSRITNSLTAYAGLVIRLRFVYSFTTGSYYLPGSGVGLYLDDIAVSNAEQLLNEATNNLPGGTSFSLLPSTTNNCLVRVRAQIPGRTLSWGPTLRLSVTTPPPAIQLVSRPALAGNQIQLDFNVGNYRTNMTFQLWRAPDLAGTWTFDGSASFTTITPNSKFRATTSTGGASRMFYRIKGSY
jgi:hypothetical protein